MSVELGCFPEMPIFDKLLSTASWERVWWTAKAPPPDSGVLRDQMCTSHGGHVFWFTGELIRSLSRITP